jgi:hypothetical protein
MKITRAVVGIAVALAASSSFVWAAPVESVESSRASTALQKVDAFLSEKVVAGQLTALGVSQEQVKARVAQLSEAQLQQLAAQVDLIHAGGMIQGTELQRLGPLHYMNKQLGVLLHNLFQLLFVWGDLK